MATIRRMLPAKDSATPIRCDDCNSPNGVATNVARIPSALSFSLRRGITPSVFANGTRLPCRAQKVRPGKAVSVTEPSPDSPRVFPHASPYESRSLGYRSRPDIRCLAPSPRNLTGKLFRSYSSSKGQRLGSWHTSGPYPQLMRPRFLDPLSPFGEISSFTLITDWCVGCSGECVSLEHDDRQVTDLPTARTVSRRKSSVTRFFNPPEAARIVVPLRGRWLRCSVARAAENFGRCVSLASQNSRKACLSRRSRSTQRNGQVPAIVQRSAVLSEVRRPAKVLVQRRIEKQRTDCSVNGFQKLRRKPSASPPLAPIRSWLSCPAARNRRPHPAVWKILHGFRERAVPTSVPLYESRATSPAECVCLERPC